MAKKPTAKKTVETITHDADKRKNIPTAEFQAVVKQDDQNPIRVAYERRNRDLDPQLVWRGKDEQDWSDLVVHAPPLYIQEKVHPKVLIDDLRKQTEKQEQSEKEKQLDLFADFNGIPKGADKTDFYQHDQNWSNRMILGDSLQVMASLAEREGLRGKVQCIYFDPPYGIKFNSNFQWSTTSGTPDQPDLPEDSSSDATDNSGAKAAGALPPALAGNVFKPYQLADKPENSGPPRRRTLADVDHEIARSSRKTRLVFAVSVLALLIIAAGVGVIWSKLPQRWENPIASLGGHVKQETKPLPPAIPTTAHSVPPIQPAGIAPSKDPQKLRSDDAAEPGMKDRVGPDEPHPPASPKPAVPQADNAMSTMPSGTSTAATPMSSKVESSVKEPNTHAQLSIDTRWKKTTDILTINSSSDPFENVVLWAPVEMHLALEPKTNKKQDSLSVYRVREQSGGPQLATIESIKGRLGGNKDLQEFTLKLTNIAAEPKIKKLNWCEIEIFRIPAKTIRFHRFPIQLSMLDKQFIEDTKQYGQYHLTWPLDAEIGQSNIPIIRVEHLSLLFSEVEFGFDDKTVNYTHTPGVPSILSVQFEKLTAFVKKDLTEEVSAVLEPITLNIEPLLTNKDENGDGKLSIMLHLSGWNKSIVKLKSHQQGELTKIKIRVNNSIPPILASYSLKMPPPKFDIDAQISKLRTDIDTLKARVQKAVNDKMVQPAPELFAAAETANGDLNLLLKSYQTLAAINERFRKCTIRTAALYYEVKSSFDSQVKKITIINDAP